MLAPLTVDGSELLLVRPGQDLFVQSLGVFELPLLQVARRLWRSRDEVRIQESRKRVGRSFITVRQKLEPHKCPHQVIFGLGHVGVVGAQLGLVDLQSSSVVVLHLVVLALVLTQQGQVVQLLGHVWVVLPQHLETK